MGWRTICLLVFEIMMFRYSSKIILKCRLMHKMENFIDDNMASFNKLAEEFLKKIQKHKELYASKSDIKSLSEKNE